MKIDSFLRKTSEIVENEINSIDKNGLPKKFFADIILQGIGNNTVSDDTKGFKRKSSTEIQLKIHVLQRTLHIVQGYEKLKKGRTELFSIIKSTDAQYVENYLLDSPKYDNEFLSIYRPLHTFIYGLMQFRGIQGTTSSNYVKNTLMKELVGQ